jgi:tetratricopeptide (TPR) repeat protein
MANPTKLKERARSAENRGQWTDAVVLYRQLLEDPGSDDADVGLWNRVGDLHLKLGETDRAVDAYERAVNAYTDSGLFNNAIALCRKILRLVPGRTSVYLRLGQISAGAGFLADARQSFLEYADRMRRGGKLDVSFDALKEFADLSPDDTEVRRILAEQLLSHGRAEEAVEQLRILLGALDEAGEEDLAARVREQILSIDPDADASPLRRSRAAEHDAFSAALDDGTRAPAAPGPPPVAAVDDFGPTVEPAEIELEGGDGETLDGLEPTALEAPTPLEGLEHTSLDDEGAPAEPLEVDREPGEEEDEYAADDLPFLPVDEVPVPRPAGDAAGAPTAGAEPAPRVDTLEQRMTHAAASPEDADARDELVRDLRSLGRHEEVVEVLEAAHRALAARGMYGEAVAPITGLIGLDPDNGLLLQKRVEYAFRSGQPPLQVEAYLDLGRHLARHNRGEKATAVFRRVLELDPHNVEARAATAQAAAAPPARGAPPGAPAAGTEYVDLASLILDEEDGPQPSTRFVVEEREPSGDEDRDFADMLAHFRQKVAENIEVEDNASHYDLGVAFMEMGLVDEAIAQFQVALRGGADPLATLELLGQCFVEKGQFAVAGRVLDRALRLPGAADGDLVGVLYLLGRVDEGTGGAERALDYYERVVAVDIRFRDTAKRIERLRSTARTL